MCSPMDAIDSVQKLCHRLISSAFQRCRLSEEPCRLSVVLNGSRLGGLAVTRISISDTGIACLLEEFQDIKFAGGLYEKWDGMLSLRTTGTCDEEIANHNLNLKEGNPAHWMNKLPSIPKNGLRFSGTEVCLSVLEKTKVLLDEICSFFHKMLILNIPNIGFELLAHHDDASGPQYENVLLPNECNPSSLSVSSLEHLESGFADYVLKHRYNVTRGSGSHTSTIEHLKTGIGTENSSSSGLVMEAVIIISDFSDHANSYMMECGPGTEVVYFKDFAPSQISNSSLSGLLSIDWKSYGLKLVKIVGQESCPLLEWEHLPPLACVDMAFHCYQKKNPCTLVRQKSFSIRTLLKKAAKLALDDLKEKHKGFLLSDRAIKIRSYAPDLAKTLAGLIVSSKDFEFQEECLSLLGLQPQEVGDSKVEECIKDKIISVIEQNDRKPQGCKDAAPLLFEYDDPLDLDLEEEHEEADGAFDFQSVR